MIRLWKRVALWFTELYTDGFGFVRRFVKPAISVVSVLREIVESPEAEDFARFTHWQWDDKLLGWFRRNLPNVLTALEMVSKCEGEGSNAQRFQCYVNELRALPPEKAAKIKRGLALYLHTTQQAEQQAPQPTEQPSAHPAE
jgi:hypothetical protein